MKTYIFLLITFLFLYSCNSSNKNRNVNKAQVALALIDSIPITCDSIDNLSRQELFDELNRIYLIRKVTLNQVIRDRLLQLEATKQHISVNDLTTKLFVAKISIRNLDKYASDYYPQNRISELRSTLKFYDIKSGQGQEILLSNYKTFILNQYIDSLKNTHQITILLGPPKPPKITIDNLLVHYKGNMGSKIILLIISDFDCEMCRENNPTFEKIYFEYKDKIRFGFTHFGSYVSNSAIASECASNQGQFWAMHDSIFNFKIVPDTTELFHMAKNIGLNMESFRHDFFDKLISEKIKNNLSKLESAGIYGTPTIMINNHILFNSASIDGIKKTLNDELAK
jgi:protein-disulfide isomerase